ncbi:MAG: ferrochelatase [Bacillota bacterium]
MPIETVGILVMAYGTPDGPDDILPYYTDIRRGRAPSPELLQELQDRYQAIGLYGRLTRITQAQTAGIERILNVGEAGRSGPRYKAYVGMKHWKPYIADAVADMVGDGVRRAVALVMAPQGGRMSIGSYYEILDQVLADMPEPIRFAKVQNWHLEPDFLAALEERVRDAFKFFPEAAPDTLDVVFTAHSLPERILTWHDPYPEHLRQIGEAVAQRTGLKKVHFAYQSAGRTPDPWLGPEIREKLRELQAGGAQSVLVCPVGFVADHLEVLYDLDIELRRLADELGVHLERTQSLNDHPLLLSALASVVRRQAEGGETA